MNRLFILTVFLFSSGCVGSKSSTCRNFFESCNKKTPLPPCESLVLYDSTANHMVPPIDDLVSEIDSLEFKNFIGEEYSELYFSKESKGADSFWYYNNSGKMENGMMIGTEGVISLKGCGVMS